MRPSSLTRSSQHRHKPVLVRDQRAEAVRKLLGQHRQHAVREIHRRAALARLGIERTARLHVVTHVGDRDDHLPAATRAFAMHRVVVVARVLAVDRDELDAAQVLPAGNRALRDAATVRARLGQRAVRELERQAVRVDGDLRFHAGRAVLPDQARDPPDGLRAAAGLLCQLDDDDLPGLRAAKPGLRHQHPVRDARVVGRSATRRQPRRAACRRLPSCVVRAPRRWRPGACRESSGPRCARQHGRHESLRASAGTAGRSRRTHRPASATRRRCAGPARSRSPGPAIARAGSTGRGGSAPPRRASPVAQAVRRRRPPRRDRATR